MNYPVWYLPETGGGFLIALIAIVHVFISHFAVGGGLYLVMAERKGLRENSAEILEFTRRHAKFFMLVSMVFGGITGVGIWFIIALVQPAATSALIHTFVYGWAAEWVWFLVEIVALIVYYYTFGKMDSRTHQKVGWIYFIAAWLSLFLINGIIDFMLTPGVWVENHNFWSGFFNPSFWPSLFFRSFFSFMLAGLYAFVTCAFLRDIRLKAVMTRYSGKWALSSILLALPCAWWYLSVLPEPARILIEGGSPTIRAVGTYAVFGFALLFVMLLLLTLIKPALNNRAVAILTLVPAFLLLGSFEWTREAARRPFVLNKIMYSNGVTLAQAETLQGVSFLDRTKFAAVKEVSEDNLSEAGAELFKFQCYACHTIGGINNDILPKTESMEFAALTTYLLKVIHKRPYMAPFFGNEKEAQALAAYIAGDLHGKPVDLQSLSPAANRGQDIYDNHCIGCHDIDIVFSWAKELTPGKIISGLESLSKINASMEDFTGTSEEKKLLAEFLASTGSPSTAVATGEDVFTENCTGCHGPEVVLTWARDKSIPEITSLLGDLGQLNSMMTGLSLAEKERQDVAAWLNLSAQGGQ